MTARARHVLRGLREETVAIPVEGHHPDGPVIEGTLALPERARGLVLFAHGSGSSRFSPRNQFVANVLQDVGLGTLLVDLLTAEEESIDDVTGHLRFDIDRLAARVVTALDWAATQEHTRDLRFGLFGASTGAAAALVAAADRPSLVGAVVSRGGRPDLAEARLPAVQAPTLLVVGARDFGVVELNQRALEMLMVDAELRLVAGATHLFDEPGALEEVSRLASSWLERYLVG